MKGNNFEEERLSNSTNAEQAGRNEEDAVAAVSREWMREADELDRKGIAAEASRTLKRCSAELTHASVRQSERAVTLVEAAFICGYSADHLGRMVRDGVLENVGRPLAPRIRVGDLPRKPRRLTRHKLVASVKAQVARGIASSNGRDNAQT